MDDCKDGGRVRVGPLRLPFSNYASDAARRLFVHELSQGAAPPGAGPLELRAFYDRFNDHLLRRVQARYPAEVSETIIGGVRVHRVRAKGRAENPGLTIINLHGGAFIWGAGSGALVESIPIACLTGAEVINVDYRMAPEHGFPAASEDVAGVYRALLQYHAPARLGMFGCSAGALLTAQCVARFRAMQLPAPGAIALISGSGIETEGDSAWLGPSLSGESSGEELSASFEPLTLKSLAYLQTAAEDDPELFPGASSQQLGGFPTTLLLCGSRDFAASAASTFHRRLLGAGVDARLIVFDGMWHAFHIYPELPEAVEANGLLAQFFLTQLNAAHAGQGVP